VLDVCRFLFGEAKSLYCHTLRVNPAIKGEDVANVWMEMGEGVHCYAEMSYASILEHEVFPQTLILIEGENGSISLEKDYWIKVTTRQGTRAEQAAPKLYPWVDPEYPVVHSSIVDCNQNILKDLQGKGQAENTGDDNIRTIELVFSAYESAKNRQVIHF
jgi:predicted dehydrogenase